MKTLTIFKILFLILLPAIIHAQDTITISLPQLLSEQTLPPGNYAGIKIEGMVPTINYQIKVEQDDRLPAVPSVPVTVSGGETACDLDPLILEYNNFISKKYIDKTEEGYKEIYTQIKKLLDKSDCAKGSDAKGIASTIVKRYSVLQPLSMNITLGENITITIIRRNEANTSDEKTWIFKYKTKDRGKFFITYGFAFAPKVWEPDSYYTKELATDSFSIKRQTAPGKLEFTFLPTIFINWIPTNKFNSVWTSCLTGGLGANAENFAAMIGMSFMYNQTIGISIGGAFYNQKRLFGQYSENEIVKTALTEDQLHKSVIRLNAYIAIQFRLSESPFNKSSK